MGRKTRAAACILSLCAVSLFFFLDKVLAAPGDTIPHGGFDTSTDACLQCHDIHQAKGDYVLTRWPTVTAVCGSCHTLYQQRIGSLGGESGPVQTANALWAIRWDGERARLNSGSFAGIPGAEDLASGSAIPQGKNIVNYDVNYGGLEAAVPGWSEAADPLEQVGNGAPFEAYQKPLGSAVGLDGLRGHRLGSSFALGQETLHGDGVTDSLDYIPGSSQRVTAIKTPSIGGAGDPGYGYMLPLTNVADFPVSLNGGLYCASCHAPHGQFSGEGTNGPGNSSNMVSYQVIDKLLTKRPNHSAVESDFEFSEGDAWLSQGGGEFCAKCHDLRVSNTEGLAPHNHPSFACLQCHGNEAIVSGLSGGRHMHLDFPHTSANPNLLTIESDALCLNCHSPGALPLP